MRGDYERGYDRDTKMTCSGPLVWPTGCYSQMGFDYYS